VWEDGIQAATNPASQSSPTFVGSTFSPPSLGGMHVQATTSGSTFGSGTSFASRVFRQWLSGQTATASTPLASRTLKVAQNAWASPTWTARIGLLRRFEAARGAIDADDLGFAMAQFVEAQQVLPSSKLTYAKTLSSIASHLEAEAPFLATYMAGLRKMGAAAPTHQAVPITRDDMTTLIMSRTGRMRLALFVAWKTASRWSDVLELTKASFIDFSPDQLVIEWSSTKTSSPSDFRAWRWTVIHDPAPMRWVVSELSRMAENSVLTETTTQQLVSILERLFPGKHYTAHSIKRGAIDCLVAHAASGRLDLKLIPLLAKHQDPATTFPATTIRYAADKVQLALMLGSHHATRLL
jgi:hypothetical protein